MFTYTRPFSPCSSPASSPAPLADSSPASSPDTDFTLDLQDPPPLTLGDPLAASAKATRLPPEHEKKSVTPPCSPVDVPTKSKKRARHDDWQPDPTLCFPVTGAPPYTRPNTVKVYTAEDLEDAIWDDASTQVVDNAHGTITLENKNLTRIPDSFITDLINVYIPPQNSDSIPTGLGRANLPSMGRTFSRTRSTVGRDPKEFHLYLAFNQITALPLKLFTLQNLTVLSIRQNKLTFIPPEIIWLRNLQELNIAGNLLKYLPAEMMEMSSLTQLQAFPNPCYLKQLDDKWYSSATSGTPSESVDKRCCISDTEHTLPKIIPLVEMAFRVLLSQSLANPEECLLDEYYNLPLDECPSDSIHPSDITSGKRRFPYPIPSPLREILRTCVPYSVYSEQPPPKSARADDPLSGVTGVGHCPSPRHRDQAGRHFKSGVFVHHAEQRVTWESHIAGLAVGGYVPVLWRGCQWGCLDYLDEDSRVGNNSSESPEELGGNLDHSDDEDMDDIVQVFQLSGVGQLDEFDSD